MSGKSWIIGAFAGAVLGTWPGQGHAINCPYRLEAPRLLQCRAIQLRSEYSPAGKPAWTYVDNDSPGAGLQAHLVCACETAAAVPSPLCEAHRTRHLTLALPSKDVPATCAQGDGLCRAPCQKLLDH